MAWYVDPNGRQVWVVPEETVYTVTLAADDLPVHTLTYLSVSSKKGSYTEHAIQEETENTKGRKKEQAGKQRGFIVRVDNESEECNVVSFFQAAARKLHQSGVVSRIDHDENSGERKKKKKKARDPAKAVSEEQDEEGDALEIKHIDLSTLADNECRIETMARCTHNAHGPGFRVEVAQGGSRQALHMFTDKKELSVTDWLDHVSAAIRSTGPRVMDCRVAAALVPTDDKGHTLEGGAIGARRMEVAEAGKEDDEWLSSMMGMAAPEKEQRSRPAASEGYEGEKKENKDLPPWMRKRERRTKPPEAGG